jgi:serine/threonine protein kinase
MSDLSVLNLTPGQQLGGYTLVARLGGGAMGSVWRVQDDGGQEYAMKILRDSLNDQTNENQDESLSSSHDREGVDARERLRREALALRKINHPGVCNIVDMELDDALAFIVTELIDGRTLSDDVATNGKYIGDDLERLSRKLMDAVRAVHAAGIVHRDIKPSNVMISERGPVLVDFGIAMGTGESHVTRTGLVMGTPGFIAPEIIDGEESDATADWWSTAAVLGFAATGKAIFGVKPMMAVLERAASGNADLSGLPAGTLSAFRKALAPKRQDRCSPDDLLRAITLDAMIPELWKSDDSVHNQATSLASATAPTTASSGTQGENPEQTEVMRPFGKGSYADETLPALTGNTTPLDTTGRDPAQNPRRLWETHMPSSTRNGEGAESNTEIFPPLTTTMPQPPEDALNQTTILSNVGSNNSQNVDDTGEVDDEIEAATEIAIPPLDASEQYPQDFRPASYSADPQPFESEFQEPRSLDEVLGLYRMRGNLVILGFGVILAAVALALPTVAIMLSNLILWYFFTQGLITEARLNRQARRGGQYKRSDGALSLTASPWYLLKSLLQVIPRALLSLAIVVVIATCVAVLWDMPNITGAFNALGISVHIPLIGGTPLAGSGITLALSICAAWLVAALGPRSQTPRIGAGRLLARYQGVFDAESENNANSYRQRIIVAIVIWAIVIVAAIAVAASKQSIDWTPIPLLES